MLTDEEKRILLQNRLFAELPAERLDGLLQKLSSRTACFGKNSVIWGMGERIDHAGIVLSGRVEAWRYTQDGQESLSAVHEAGGLFGDVLMSARTAARSSFARQGRPRSCFYRWTHCSAAARRMAEATAHGCCPICWRRSRRNTGHYSAISASCPFRTGGQGWKRICGRRREKPARSSAPE